MNKKYLSILLCPKDENQLEILNEKVIDKDEIESGSLKCKKCKKNYPIINGVPRFIQQQGYVENFGFQWERHSRTQIDIDAEYNEKTFFNCTGLTPSDIKGKLFLDAGCGKGRYSHFIRKYGGSVIGVDMSNAVDQANYNLGSDNNSNFIQAQIGSLPFSSDSFDFIFSIGVLHHTPNPEESFKSLIQYLKKGGSISISVYNKGAILYEWSKRLRKHSIKMNHKTLYFICKIACRILYPLYRLPILKLLIHYVPIDMHPNYDWRLLNTFDAYSPVHASTHTYPEVYNWFKTNQLTSLDLLPAPVSVRGEKTDNEKI